MKHGMNAGRSISKTLLRISICTVLLLGPALFLPAWLCGRDAESYFRGDVDRQRALARHVVSAIRVGVTESDFDTGQTLYDLEWQFGSYMMAGVGLGQMILEHPETRDEFLPEMEKILDALLDDRVAHFDSRKWGEKALENLDGNNDHAGYLGYTNLVLGLHRQISPRSKYTDWHDRITRALEDRLASNPYGLLETYPGERYPIDNCSVIGSISMHAGITGRDVSALLDPVIAGWRKVVVDSKTGLLIQGFNGKGKAIDKPRASGTAFGLYMLSLGGVPIARELFESVRRECSQSFLGFGSIREYGRENPEGKGDVDSGPVLFGTSFSGTGFMIAGCRVFGDFDLFQSLYSTVHLVGAPLDTRGGRNFVSGGPLGNSIMFAMLTARPMKGVAE